MKNQNNPLLCEFFADKLECDEKVDEERFRCHAKYESDPEKLKEICDKMEDEGKANCRF